jgi:hypothetical protein
MTAQNPGWLGALLRLFAPASKKKPVLQTQNQPVQAASAAPEVYPYRLRDDFL